MFKEFIKKIENHKRVAVFSHVRPDGDCIGSQVALCRWLTGNGLEAEAFNDDEVPENIKWLTNFFPVSSPAGIDFSGFDLFILVDGNAAHRFGLFEDISKKHAAPVVVIDHHPDPDPSFEMILSDVNATSTCELIYRLYSASGIDKIDEEVAKAIYTGVITDTGSLQFDSVTPEAVELVADLLRRGGFKPNEIIERIYSNKTVPQLQLLSRALNTVQLYADNQIAVMYVTQAMLNETKTTSADTEGFVSYPLSISGVKAAILFKDLEGAEVRMSLRSRSSIDVNEWARQFGGGGHKKAAGASCKGTLKEAILETVEAGINLLKES